MEKCIDFIQTALNNIYDDKKGAYEYDDGKIKITVEMSGPQCIRCSYITQYFNYKNCDNINDVDRHIAEYMDQLGNGKVRYILGENNCVNIAQLIDRIKAGTETMIWQRTFVVDNTGMLKCKIHAVCGSNSNSCTKEEYLDRNGILTDLELVYTK